MTSATQDKNTNFNISKNKLCKVGVSGSIGNRAVQFTNFLVIFAYAIKLSSSYFRKLRVIHDISKQIEQRSRIGKVFACWHLAIAITKILNMVTHVQTMCLPEKLCYVSG